MITEDKLYAAFSSTCEFTRVTLDEGLRDEKGEGLNTLYAVIERLGDETPFSAVLLHSDGGVQEFMITYKFGDFSILVARVSRGSDQPPFEKAQRLAKWLNMIEAKIKATAMLMSV